MHRKFAEHTDIDCNRSGGKRDGIGKGGAGNVVYQSTVEFNNFGVDQFHHSGVEHKIEHMKIGQKNLVEKPGDVADKPQPANNKSRLYPRRKQKSLLKAATGWRVIISTWISLENFLVILRICQSGCFSFNLAAPSSVLAIKMFWSKKK